MHARELPEMSVPVQVSERNGDIFNETFKRAEKPTFQYVWYLKASVMAALLKRGVLGV